MAQSCSEQSKVRQGIAILRIEYLLADIEQWQLASQA